MLQCISNFFSQFRTAKYRRGGVSSPAQLTKTMTLPWTLEALEREGTISINYKDRIQAGRYGYIWREYMGKVLAM